MASQEETLAQQAALTQRKLEKHYTTVYKFLLDYEHSIETVQHVLVWKRPALSLVLYAFVHWIFVLQVRSSDGPISQFGNIVFWLMVADVLYRAATKENTPTETATATATGNESDSTTTSGDGSGSGASEEGSGRRWWLRRRVGGGGGGGASGGQSTAMVKFEDAIMKRHTPRETGELPPYEVICLWIADILLLADNTTLVLKHWSINEPLMFSVILGVPGLVLALLGRYIPTLVLLYIVVMFLLTWPYIEHHNLRVRVVALAQAHYPGILRRAKASFKFLKKLVLSRNKEDSPEFSLSEGGDEARTEQALQEAFDQATGQQNQQTGGGQGPGMSLLQDSVLGMQPNAFQHADMDSLLVGSLAPGPGEFPSISELDQSLCLPSFPSHSHGGGGGGTMPSIGEELEDDDTTCSLALSSQGSNTDLDPLTDSLVELGFDFSDAGAGGHRSNMTGQQRHHLQRQAQPSPLATTSARAPAQSSRGSGLGYSQGFQPPPTYQSAIDGSDGGFTTAGGGGGEGRDGYEWPIIDPPMPLGGRMSGSGPKSSSTPLIREGMRLRRGAGRTTTGATQQQQPSSAQQQSAGANQEAANLNGLLQELDTL